jgi:hypothetical protein
MNFILTGLQGLFVMEARSLNNETAIGLGIVNRPGLYSNFLSCMSS